MSVIKLPEGVELDMNVYIAGLVGGEEVEMVVSVKGLPAFSDAVKDQFDLEHLVDTHKLTELGDNWRMMTRAEIADYKDREKADREAGELILPL